MVEYPVALGKKPLSREETFLDIGSGYGFFPTYLSSYSYTICSDIDREVMIYQKKASKSIKKAVPQELDCIVADCTRLPFKSEVFSKVFIISTIEHIEQDRMVARESGRVLCENGFCSISFPLSKFARPPQSMPYYERSYTSEDVMERIVIPSSLSLEEQLSFRKTFVSYFYKIVPEGWFIFKDLIVGLALFKLDESGLAVGNNGALSIIKLRKSRQEYDDVCSRPTS